MFLLVSKTLKTTVLLFLLGECNISATEICFGPRLFMCGFSFEFDPPVGNAWGGLLSRPTQHAQPAMGKFLVCLFEWRSYGLCGFLVEKSFSKIIFFRESEFDICGNVEDFGFFFREKGFIQVGFRIVILFV